MKIEDPRVQRYIAGQLSQEEEAALLLELYDHPEVADLAETLKRTQALIQQDIHSGEVPEIAKDRSLFLEPSSLMEETFKPWLGENWKSTLAFVSFIFVVFIFLVGIFALRPEKKESEPETSAARVKENKRSSQQSGGASGTSSAQGRTLSDSSLAQGQVSQLMSREVVKSSPGPLTVRAEFTRRVSSMADLVTPSLDRTYLPVQVDIEAAEQAEKVLESGKKLPAQQVPLLELVNKNVEAPGLEVGVGRFQLSVEGAPCPWDASSWVMTVALQSESTVSDEPRMSSEFAFLGLSDLAIEALVRGSSQVQKGFSSIDEAMEKLKSKAQGENLRLVLTVARFLSEAELLELRKWLGKPNASLVILDGTAKLKKQISGHLPDHDHLRYFSTPTPLLLKKGFYNFADGAGLLGSRLKLNLQPKIQNMIGFEQLGSKPAVRNTTDPDLAQVDWMAPGETVTSVFLIQPKPDLEEKASVLEVSLSYAENGSLQSSRADVLVTDFGNSKNSELHRQAIAMSWLGLMLKEEVPLTENSIAKLESYLGESKSEKIRNTLDLIKNLYL